MENEIKVGDKVRCLVDYSGYESDIIVRTKNLVGECVEIDAGLDYTIFFDFELQQEFTEKNLIFLLEKGTKITLEKYEIELFEKEEDRFYFMPPKYLRYIENKRKTEGEKNDF
jgi:hypothetical protein